MNRFKWKWLLLFTVTLICVASSRAHDPASAESTKREQGSLVGEIGEHVMRDRERLSQDGFVVAYVPIDKRRRLAGETRLISRGFLRMDASADLMAAAQAELERGLRHSGRRKRANHDQAVRETLERFFYRETGSRPVVLPNIVHVQ